MQACAAWCMCPECCPGAEVRHGFSGKSDNSHPSLEYIGQARRSHFFPPPQPNPHLPLFIVLEPKKLPAYLLGSFRRTDPHHPHSPNTTGDRRRSAVVCHSVFRRQAFLSDPTSVDRSYHGDPPNPSRHVSFRQHHPSCSLRVVRIDPCVTNANYTERCGEFCAVRGG